MKGTLKADYLLYYLINYLLYYLIITCQITYYERKIRSYHNYYTIEFCVIMIAYRIHFDCANRVHICWCTLTCSATCSPCRGRSLQEVGFPPGSRSTLRSAPRFCT